MASGSVQLPRFTLLESGSLLISPSHLSDAGTYTCMASNSRGIDEASADLVVWGKHNITTFMLPTKPFYALSSMYLKFYKLNPSFNVYLKIYSICKWYQVVNIL